MFVFSKYAVTIGKGNLKANPEKESDPFGRGNDWNHENQSNKNLKQINE